MNRKKYTSCVQTVFSSEIYLYRQTSIMNETLIFFKISFNVFLVLKSLAVKINFPFRQEEKADTANSTCEYGGCCTFTNLCFTKYI